jgi:DNA-binding response OmpR family regulator
MERGEIMNSLDFLKHKSALVAEDDIISRTYILKTLSYIFKDVYAAENGEQAYELYNSMKPDILITDIKMPKCDGLSLVRRIRRDNYALPIILITSFTERDLLIDAANLSVDGYLVKPLVLEQLTASLKKSFNRTHSPNVKYTLGEHLIFDAENCTLIRNDTLVLLGVKEMELLRLLITYASKIVSKEEISHTLWPLEPIHDSTLKMTVARLRKKMGVDIIESVRGFGYRIVIEKSD